MSDPDDWSVGSEALPSKVGAACSPGSRLEESTVLGMASNKLLKELDPQMLRGISMNICLSGWGKHLSSKQANNEVEACDYGLSFQVSKLDYFLSHDWATSRSNKLLILLIYFNCRAAALTAMSSAILLAFCREMPDFQDLVDATTYTTRTTVLTSLLPQVIFVLPGWILFPNLFDTFSWMMWLNKISVQAMFRWLFSTSKVGPLLLATTSRLTQKAASGFPRQTLHCSAQSTAEGSRTTGFDYKL